MRELQATKKDQQEKGKKKKKKKTAPAKKELKIQQEAKAMRKIMEQAGLDMSSVPTENGEPRRGQTAVSLALED
eukprot:COSAG06_NODE_36616_length_445_cov_0.401734_1_plen_73_part_10